MRLKQAVNERSFWLQAVLIVLIFAVYLFHAAQMGDWIMDDAGISFVYARNLAQGHGLVSQPGRIPVEGYSNPLWVFLLVPFFWLNLFDPIVTPKVISAVLVFLSIVFLYLGSRRVLGSRILAGFVCALVVAHTSLAVWTISGMENPLYLLLSVLLFWTLVAHKDRRRLPMQTGILTGLISLTRPDGLVYLIVFPMYLILERMMGSGSQKRPLREMAKDLGRFLLPFGVLAGGYFLFRVLYFKDVLPNPYYAKGFGNLRSKRWLYLVTLQGFSFDKIMQLMDLTLGRLAALGLLVVTASVAFFTGRGTFSRRQWIPLLLLAPSAIAYIILPEDWMREFRFATTYIPYFYLLLVSIGLEWSEILPIKNSWKRVLLILFMLSFLGINVKRHIRRTLHFARNPPTPFLLIADKYGDRYDTYASKLGLKDASVLTIDMGGTLYYTNLKVYDLGGLTDRTIARTLHRDIDAFHDYVFEETRPTFITTYSSWAEFAALDDDPRFRRDYVPIHESIDPILQQFGYKIYSGTYVRIDALGDISRLELLR